VTTPDLLEKVTDVRLDVRAIVRSEVPVPDRCIALIELATEVREAETDPHTRSRLQHVLYEEARGLLEDAPPGAWGIAYEAKQRRIRAEGHAECPTCGSALATDADFVRWREMRRAERELLEARERVLSLSAAEYT
jgi:hypothetical protein